MKQNKKQQQMKTEEELNEEILQTPSTTDETDVNDSETTQTETCTTEEIEVDPLTAANSKIAELQDKYLRQVAEFDNFRKRTLKEKAELILNGGEKTLTAILPVIDDMERALQTMEKAEEVNAVKEGVELIFQKFTKILEGQGLRKIETCEQDFNTDFHEAIALIPTPEEDKKGKIIDCVQTGYTLNDKVIRHAKVAVGQ